MSAMQPLMYPNDFIASLLMMPVFLCISISGTYLIFYANSGHLIAGVSIYEMLFVEIFSALIWLFSTITPLGNGMIGFQIISGGLDRFILQPLPGFLSIFFQKLYIQKFILICIRIVLLLLVLFLGHFTFSLIQLLQLLFILVTSMILLHSIFIFGEALNFWFPNSNFSQHFFQYAQNYTDYPSKIYPDFFVKIFTYLIPLFLIGNPVYFILKNEFTLTFFYIIVGISILWTAIACILWQTGKKHYQSAN